MNGKEKEKDREREREKDQLTRHGVRPEEVVVECRVRVDPLGGVEPQELVDQVAGVGVLDVGFQALFHPEK